MASLIFSFYGVKPHGLKPCGRVCASPEGEYGALKETRRRKMLGGKIRYE